MHVNAPPATSSAIHHALPYWWQPIISPDSMMVSTSNCLPVVEYPARLVDAKHPSGVICEVDQDVVIVEKRSPAGAVFIPIQPYLSSTCTKFHRRKESNNEYMLGDIYIAIMSEPGYVGAKQCISPLLCRLQTQLIDGAFACSEQGQFTLLLIYLHQPIKIRRQGAIIVSPEGPDELEDARFEHLVPYHCEGRDYPGYYWMYISLPAFGGYVLNTMGTPRDLLHMFRSK